MSSALGECAAFFGARWSTSGSLLDSKGELAKAVAKIVELLARRAARKVVTRFDDLRGKEIRDQRAVFAVHHDAEEFAGLAQHEIAARGGEVAKEAANKSVVHAHVIGVGRIEFEGHFAVTRAAVGDEQRFGELERLQRDGISLYAQPGELRGCDREHGHARIKRQEDETISSVTVTGLAELGFEGVPVPHRLNE